MIVRMWRGQAKAENADAYERFVTTKVFAELPAIAGHRGAYLLKLQPRCHARMMAAKLGTLQETRGWSCLARP